MNATLYLSIVAAAIFGIGGLAGFLMGMAEGRGLGHAVGYLEGLMARDEDDGGPEDPPPSLHLAWSATPATPRHQSRHHVRRVVDAEGA